MNPTDPRQGPCPAESATIVRMAPTDPTPPGTGWEPPWRARQLGWSEISRCLRLPRPAPCPVVDRFYPGSAFRRPVSP